MKQIASKLGLGHLALLFSGCMLFAGLQSGAGALYLAQQDQQASGSGATAIVQAALNIVYHISFTTLNPVKDKKGKNVFTHYSENDGKTNPYPGLDQQKLLKYWQQGNVNLFDVECAGFVSGVLDQANYPMVQPLGLAIDYWEHPGNSFPSSDWQYVLPLQGGEIPPSGINPIKGLPLPGDIAVFSEAKDQPPGHVAVVVAVNPPTSGQTNGTIVLAQANFTPNYYTSDPGKSTWKGANPVSWITTADIPLYVAPLTPMGNIDLSPRPLLGYIRNLKAQAASTGSTTGTGSNSGAKLPKSSWVAVAEADAEAQGIPGTLFAKQINQESGFNPNSLSPTGAEGIAQFEPATARGLGINPLDPTQALEAAAKMMADSYKSYLNPITPKTVAYEKALANYNCGACIRALENQWGSAWITHFPTFADGQTWNYIKIIAPWVELPGCGLAPQLSSPGMACSA